MPDPSNTSSMERTDEEEHWRKLDGMVNSPELQVLRADIDNRKKVGNNFYKTDEESFVTIREELYDDFLSLAGAHLSAFQLLIERLDDDQLSTQLQFEHFEREQQRWEVAWMTTEINISDEEQSIDPQPHPDQPPNEAGWEQQGESSTKQAGDAKTEIPAKAGGEGNARAGAGMEQTQPDNAEQQEQQSEEPLEPLDQSILDILDEDWWSYHVSST